MTLIEEIKNQITDLYPKSEVILFGSRARGDFRKESDWDFLILLNQEKIQRSDKTLIKDVLYDLELKYDTVISTLIHSKKEWKRHRVTPIYEAIEKEGIKA